MFNQLLYPIDKLLNDFTMYKVVLFGLQVIVVFAAILSLIGMLPFTFLQFIVSFLTITMVAYCSNIVLGKLFKAPINVESSSITAFILVLIMQPATKLDEWLVLVVVSLVAMASKYLLAIKTKHIFNPAAVGALFASYVFFTGASWWVGSLVLLPVVTIIGLLIVRKIRRFSLFIPFVGSSLLSIVFFGWLNGANPTELFFDAFKSWPVIFFGTIMLTEPLTTPPTRQLQALYGTLVGFLFGFPFHMGMMYSSPEFALIIGNIFAYIVSPKQKLVLTLQSKNELGDSMHEFVFTPNQKMNFAAGQYVEWTLPHLAPDGRGNRRYFTIASAPTESQIKLGVKIPKNSSSFKKALLQLEKGNKVFVGGLAGDFTLPVETNKKLVFIAGGIGVTPFRSMLKYLSDRKEARDITFFYAVSHPNELMYKDIFAQAAQTIATKVLYVITRTENAPKNWTGKVGRVTPEMIQAELPDFKERYYYLSGPRAMVTAYEAVLAGLNVPSHQIITDYFPGF